MDWIALSVVLLTAILLIGAGYLIRFRKAYGLIAGYNTMSADKKRNVDTEKLGILMGNTCFVMGGMILAGGLLLFFRQGAAGMVVLALLVPTLLYLIISAQKYDGNNRQASGKMKTGSRIMVGVIVSVFLLIIGFVAFALYQGAKPAAMVYENQSLTISGLYGQSVPAADIKNITLLETLPVIQRRTNGSAVGNQLRGHFQLQDVGQAVLYLDQSKPPFIFFETPAGKIYLNMATPDQTRQLFDAIRTTVSP